MKNHDEDSKRHTTNLPILEASATAHARYSIFVALSWCSNLLTRLVFVLVVSFSYLGHTTQRPPPCGVYRGFVETLVLRREDITQFRAVSEMAGSSTQRALLINRICKRRSFKPSFAFDGV